MFFALQKLIKSRDVNWLVANSFQPKLPINQFSDDYRQLTDSELSIGLGLFGSGSSSKFEKLSGFNRTERRSKIEIFSE